MRPPTDMGSQFPKFHFPSNKNESLVLRLEVHWRFGHISEQWAEKKLLKVSPNFVISYMPGKCPMCDKCEDQRKVADIAFCIMMLKKLPICFFSQNLNRELNGFPKTSHVRCILWHIMVFSLIAGCVVSKNLESTKASNQHIY